MKDEIKVLGARVNNLKNIDVVMPRNSLIVFTGLSGSGKSSLAFDTIFAEGQRRYIETFSAYARNFLGGLERPDVDEITGLSPVISIEQKTTNKNPRSTVGTITEIYDYIRLLFARAGIAYSYISGEPMISYTEEKVVDLILSTYSGKAIYILAPLVRNRKGHYRELFSQMLKRGYLHVRIDGEIHELVHDMKVERYANHNIEVVVDKLKIPICVDENIRERLVHTVSTAMKLGDSLLMVLDKETNTVKYYSKRLMDPDSGLAYKEPAPNIFSFNSPEGFCPRCRGIGEIDTIDIKKLIPDSTKSVKNGGIAFLGSYKPKMIFFKIEALLKRNGYDLDTPLKDLDKSVLEELLYGSMEKIQIDKKLLELNSDYFVQYGGIVEYIQSIIDEESCSSERKRVAQYLSKKICPECLGRRLNREALSYKLWDKNIADLSSMSLSALHEWLIELPQHLTNKQKYIAAEIIKEITKRIEFLLNVGLNYLSLSRSSSTLSGGESQRIRLATQIGSQLVNVLYILDEPSIGLHQRDNERLIKSLCTLRDLGNTVIVVEHDEDMIKAADWIVDIGPKAGRKGGEVVFQGTYKDMLKSHTLTADYLLGNKSISIPNKRRIGNGKFLKLYGCKGNNLKNIDVEFPLGKLIVVTGVSGSGKSTLINETLQPILSQYFYHSLKKPATYEKIEGIENIDKVISVDQSPIGRTPRSTPATYTGVLSDIRYLFANLPEAKIRGYKSGRFSFNVKAGRCEACNGNGYRTIEMNFLPDVTVPCEVCKGKRYNRETLEVRFKGKSIADVLDMTVNMAVEFFENIPNILIHLKSLQDVGLGYIKLGQSSTTLSGGESQRVKLAAELSKHDTGKTLYILDEPTTGLHFEDIRVLMNVLQKIVDKGNTVIIIEHNLDVIKLADYIIDMGPEGGDGGGQIVITGTPETVADSNVGYTSQFLEKKSIKSKKYK